MQIKNIITEIKSFTTSLYNAVSGSIVGSIKKDSPREERYDIGIDDIRVAHEKIPKKLGVLVIGFSALIIIVMSFVTWSTQISKADDKRSTVDENKTKEPDVQISIDEQGWKHFQSKRIDMLAENTQKSLEATKKEIQENSEALTKAVKDDLNETRNIVKGYVDQLSLNMNELKFNISEQLDQTLKNVDKKIKSNAAAVKDLSDIKNKHTILNENSKLLPPPLSEIPKPKNVIVKKEEVKKEEVQSRIIEPDSEEYSYQEVSIDSLEVQSGEIVTSLYLENEEKEKNIKKYHIMKGLVNATLLTGINAPTFGGSNSKNPAPVLFSVDGETLIANDEVGNIENCLISGSATGNVNTSKADILLTEISCSGYDQEGNKVRIEEQIKGWVIGENGSFGLQGRLLDSSGKVITKMIALEIIGAISDAMVAKSMPEGTSTFGGLGTGTDLTYSSATQQGLGKGISSGLDRTFEHYSQILTGMYPTISVMSGKKVTLHLKGGETLEPSRYNGFDIDEKLDVSIKEKK
ncbi:TraB/VirB10 family protein [Sulfurimonas sp.]|uniref:TraB/VirB10 family protein n=1 Tax=Sulfurimonas sp. TaxID=2022749 RepID=UPI0025D3B272|nr:TraB/VirB10 family protein [Sulfurimonas sp.]MBW6487563.1 hypothetical protein [Sulfurimonas sp.]